MKLNDKAYDFLKFLAMVALPAFATLYLGLGQLWGFPATEKVAGSIVLVNTFLGVLLQLNTRAYNNSPDGYLDATGFDEVSGHPDLKMVVSRDPKEVLNKKVARFKIGSPPEH